MTSNNVVVQFFAKYIEGQLGIVYNEANSFQLESRLTDLVAFYSLGSMNELMEKAMKGFTLDMKQMVLDVATNNETSFFRDKDLFQELAQSVLQSPRFNGSDGKPLRIWCAASSTGQEPYTIAMILDQQKSLFPTRRFSLLGTDVSDRALKRCREGIYSQLEAQRGLPAPLLIKYFTPRQNAKSLLTEYEVNAALRENLSFRSLNLLEPWGDSFGPFDVVFCRNVLIYQSVENKKKVIAKIARLLNPGGILVLGAAESLIGLSEEFKLVRVDRACYYEIAARP